MGNRCWPPIAPPNGGADNALRHPCRPGVATEGVIREGGLKNLRARRGLWRTASRSSGLCRLHTARSPASFATQKNHHHRKQFQAGRFARYLRFGNGHVPATDLIRIMTRSLHAASHCQRREGATCRQDGLIQSRTTKSSLRNKYEPSREHPDPSSDRLAGPRHLQSRSILIGCPAAALFSFLSALQAALYDLGLKPHQVVVVSGSAARRTCPLINTLRPAHVARARPGPSPTGVKLSTLTHGHRPRSAMALLRSVVNHFNAYHRRNVDLTYMRVDNQIYGLPPAKLFGRHAARERPKALRSATSRTTFNPNPRRHCRRRLEL